MGFIGSTYCKNRDVSKCDFCVSILTQRIFRKSTREKVALPLLVLLGNFTISFLGTYKLFSHAFLAKKEKEEEEEENTRYPMPFFVRTRQKL